MGAVEQFVTARPAIRGARSTKFTVLRIFPNTEFHSRFPETAAIAGGITMQAINGIQNAIINAQAGFMTGAVVDSENAHRAYTFHQPCGLKPVSQCSGSLSMSLRDKMIKRMQKRLSLVSEERQLTNGLRPGKWRKDLRHDQMPAMVWATFVLSPVTSG